MNVSWTWLGIAVCILIIAACVWGFKRGFVKEIVSAFFMILSFLMVWVINPYMNGFIRNYTPVYETVHERCQELVENQLDGQKSLNKTEQSEFVDRMPVPEMLKKSLIQNNTVETYQQLAVSSFTDYVADSLAMMAVNGISFLASYLLSVIVIRLLGYILDVLAKLPVINGINKAAGAVVGGAKCIVIIWVVFLALTLLCNTQLGQKGMELIQNDVFLNFLYSQNVFIKVFMSI